MRIHIKTTGDKNFGIEVTNARKEIRNKIASRVVDNAEHSARTYMPYFRGNMYKALRTTKNKNKAALIQDQPRDGSNRPYHLWMHGYGKYDIFNHIKSGDARFMINVRKEMIKDIRKQLRKTFK